MATILEDSDVLVPCSREEERITLQPNMPSTTFVPASCSEGFRFETPSSFVLFGPKSDGFLIHLT